MQQITRTIQPYTKRDVKNQELNAIVLENNITKTKREEKR